MLNRLFIVSVLALTSVSFICSTSVIAKPICKGKICVFDGDTISYGKEHIRIANIDAPEIGGAKCDAERRLGLIAKNRLYTLLKSDRFEIVRGDPRDGRKTDQYKRMLAVIFINKKDVGKILIDEQLARPWKGKRQSWCSGLKSQRKKFI